MADIFATTPKVTTERRVIKGPPAPHLVTVYARDGSAMEVFPVDAREIVAGGGYAYEPLAPQSEALPEPTDSADSFASDAAEPKRRGRPPRQETVT